MPDREKVIKEFELFIKGFHPACTSEGVELDMFREVLAMLKEKKPKPIVNKWHKNPFGDYSRLHCPWCDRELDMQSAKEYVACPYCGKAVKWE